MTIQQARPLEGIRVGISVASTPQELEKFGFTEAGMNRFTVRLTRALLAEGASLAFGHDWRPNGVMEAITSLASDYHSPFAEHAPIINLVPWPAEISQADPNLLRAVRNVVEVRPAGIPEELLALKLRLSQLATGTEEHQDLQKYLAARALTQLRHLLTELCQARVAVGGKLEGYSGRAPGIVEEVWLALKAGQPVYLCGLLGGAARALGKVLLDDGDPEILWRNLPMREIYPRQAPATECGLTDADLNISAWSQDLLRLREVWLNNGLSKEENRRLVESSLEEETVRLVLKGLLQAGHSAESIDP